MLQQLYPVIRKNGIVGYYIQILNLRLGDYHAIKGIPMVKRKRRNLQKVAGLHKKDRDALICKMLNYVGKGL